MSSSSPTKANIPDGSIKKIADVGNNLTRASLGIKELNDLLAGGYVPGQVILLAGEPGIGKSTLLLQVANLTNSHYVCGEESPQQVATRAMRMGVSAENITLLDTRDVDSILSYLQNTSVKAQQNPLLIVDSIQSVSSSHIKSTAGSISQVQYCASKLSEAAKKLGVAMVFVGQVTKSGYIAGPKLLEHIVDTVVSFEGDRAGDVRILRVQKNRFGPSGGLELFEMSSGGLVVLNDYTERLIARHSDDSPGSVLSVVVEGVRPLLVEVQALNKRSVFPNPRHVVNGVSPKRVEMLLAVIERRLGINTGNYDIYVNISGGINVHDTALDLPIVLAVVSVVKNKPLPAGVVAFGEVGLMGELRKATSNDKRKEEAEKRGCKLVIDSDFGSDLPSIVNKLKLGASNRKEG